MKIFLSKQCLSLTGTLGQGYGYYIRRSRGDCFYSQRSKHGNVPPDGHWRFIVLCAELAQNGLHISDIKVSKDELTNALWEAHHFIAAQNVRLAHNNAADIINLKNTFGL